MLRQCKKFALGFLALLSILIIAGCSQSSTQNDAKQTDAKEKTVDINGHWESVDMPDTIQKSFFYHGMKGITYARFLEAFNDFKINLKIEKDTVEFSYTYPVATFGKAFYSISNEKQTKSEEEFVKSVYKGQTSFSKKYNKYKVNMDEDSGIFTFDATGTLNTKDKTMYFEEGLSILNSFPLSINGYQDPTTYNYEVRDGILYVWVDGKTKENLPLHFELRFKKVEAQEKK